MQIELLKKSRTQSWSKCGSYGRKRFVIREFFTKLGGGGRGYRGRDRTNVFLSLHIEQKDQGKKPESMLYRIFLVKESIVFLIYFLGTVDYLVNKIHSDIHNNRNISFTTPLNPLLT
jgi:hypothetical protein